MPVLDTTASHSPTSRAPASPPPANPPFCLYVSPAAAPAMRRPPRWARACGARPPREPSAPAPASRPACKKTETLHVLACRQAGCVAELLRDAVGAVSGVGLPLSAWTRGQAPREQVPTCLPPARPHRCCQTARRAGRARCRGIRCWRWRCRPPAPRVRRAGEGAGRPPYPDSLHRLACGLRDIAA